MSALNEELLDLLAERALGRLSPEDEARLAELLEQAGVKDNDDMDLAVAAAMNAFAGAEPSSKEDSVPEGLAERLQADADRFFGRAEGADTPADIESARARRDAGAATVRPRPGFLGWAVAAMLALAVVLVALQPDGDPTATDPAAARAALLAEAGTSVVEWNRSDIPAYSGVTGDVVWNDERQEGYLRLTGMPANDPAISQYQLWIVDPERDENPVDGGVFDVPSGRGEVVIPINAKLDVSDPQAFAITREQPGGVVVSDGPLLIVAAS